MLSDKHTLTKDLLGIFLNFCEKLFCKTSTNKTFQKKYEKGVSRYLHFSSCYAEQTSPFIFASSWENTEVYRSRHLYFLL